MLFFIWVKVVHFRETKRHLRWFGDFRVTVPENNGYFNKTLKSLSSSRLSLISQCGRGKPLNICVQASVAEKHQSAALDLLDGDDLATFSSQLHHDVSNLKAMLRAIYIAGHVTESFSDFVVGHGELWSAQMLSYVVRKNGLDCKWMDTREVLIVNPTSSNLVDPDFLESERRLEKWFSQNPSKIIIATGFIASTPQNIPTTLKRDGSDFSAAIMGALFRARLVTIWTDVDGVYSADPRKGKINSQHVNYEEKNKEQNENE
ncbi:hypothetical protein REPUB_Repub12eG0000400 [Reevesia pubescens]